ncbi:MAG: hypothetical protein ACLFS1_06270 [Opitutales bacterium]
MHLRIAVFFLVTLPLLAGVDLQRASVAALHRDPTVSVAVGGHDPFLDTGEVSPDSPVYFGGLFNARATEPGELFLRSSNGIDFYFEGPGFFGIDRFDQSFIRKADSGVLVPEQSRLILNLREGILLVDSRGVSSEAQLMLELPFGRVSAPRGLWSISVEYDFRSQRYDFTIASAEGVLRMTDQQGEIYTLYPGQRLVGAGAYDDPGVEIAEPTSDTRERFEAFRLRREALGAANLDETEFRKKMLDIPDAVDRSRLEGKRSGERPQIIELAPAPKPLSFFRGVIPEGDSAETVDF